MKLIFKHTRKELVEGRTTGISSGFVKPTKEGFETVMPLSACKDYLNDAVLVEHVGESRGRIYGFEHKPSDAFKEGVYLVSSPLGPKKNEKSGDAYQKAKEKFDKRGELELMHQLDKMFGYELTTIVHEEDDNIVYKIDNNWVEYPYRISLYTLFLREAYGYRGEPMEEYFKDNYTMNSVLSNLEMLAKDKPEQKFKDKKASGVHNNGVVTFINSLK